MKFKITIPCSPLTGLVSAGALLLMASSASAQNIFVANWYDPGAIYEFTPGGGQSTFYSGGLGEPLDMAFNNSGNLFVADSLGNEVDEFVGGVETPFASINHPDGLAFDSSGDLYITSASTGNIYEISHGTQTVFVGGLSDPSGLAFDASGDLFVNNQGTGQLDEYLNTGGTLNNTAHVFATGLVYANGLAFNAAGDLFDAENSTGTGNILEFTPQGHQSTFISGMGGGGSLAFDSSGSLFMTDGSTLIKIAPDGSSYTTFASNLGNATGIAIQNLALPVPEPSAISLAGLGAAALCLWRRRK